MTGFKSKKSFLLPPRGENGRGLAIALLFFVPLLSGCSALWLGQDANWDLRNYHWYNAFAFLNQRYTKDLLPSQSPFFYNPLLDVPYFLLATHVSAKISAFILAAVQGLNFVFLFMLAHLALHMQGGRWPVLAAALIAALGYFGGGGISLIGTTFYDNITSLGLWLSAILILYNRNQLLSGVAGAAAMLAFLFGIPAGAMMGLKLPSVVFCVALCSALLLSGGEWHRRLLLAFFFGLGVLAGLAATLGHWAYFLYENFGNPLFPYFNNYFQSPLAPALDARDIQYVPQNWHDRLLFPFIFAQHPKRVGEIPWQDYRLTVLYILLPAALFIRLVSSRFISFASASHTNYCQKFLLWTGAIAYGVWLVMFAIYRYAIPLEMLAPLLIVFAYNLLPLRRSFKFSLAGLTLLLIACTITPGNWTRLDHWQEKTVPVAAPDLGQFGNAMVLMTGQEPFSHVVPQLPAQFSYVRVQSNFSSPEENKGINRLISDKINSHTGAYLLLSPAWQHPADKELLQKFYQLTLIEQSCQIIIDGLYNTQLQICELSKNPKTSAP